MLHRFKRPVRKRSFDLCSSIFLLLLRSSFSVVTAIHNAMPVDQSKILAEGATATVSFAGLHSSSKDTSSSLADVFGSFADIELRSEAANRITLNHVVDAKVAVSDISVATLSGSSKELAEIMPVSILDAGDEFVTIKTFSDDMKERFRARISSAFNLSISVVPLLAMKTPAWMASCMMKATVEYDEHEFNFDFEYREADPNPRIECIGAQDGPGRAAQVPSLEQNESNGTNTEARVSPGAGTSGTFRQDHLSGWCHTICWRMVSTMAMLILLGMIYTTRHGIHNICSFFWQLTIPRRSGKLVWFIMIIAIMQPSQVECASFTKKAIGQSTPIPGATNRITVTLISDTDLLAASGSIVTISGLSTAIASNPMPLLDVGDHGAMIFSDGMTGGHGIWNVGTLTLTIHSAATLSAGTTYVFAFDITNPATANTSPTIYIEASGVTSIVSSPMTVPDLSRYGVRNGANPLQVEVPVFKTKSIQQSIAQFAEATTWKVTLNSNYALSSGSTVTISGLTGSQTPESASLNVTSTESKLGSSGDWTCSSGTLVLAIGSGGTTAEMNYMVTFSLPNWAPTQLAPTVKVMAAMQDSGSIAFADMTYTTADATNSIVLSHSPPITTRRRSEKIVNIERIPTLGYVENRDILCPAIIAGSIAPREGPILKGSLVLLGISDASAILNPDVKSSLKFRMQNVDNDSQFAYGTIVAGPLSLAHWQVAESPEYDSFVRNTANFSKGSSNLVKDYQTVIQSTISFADNVDGSVVALLAVRTPNWTNACLVKAIVEYDGHELDFDFEYWEADPNPRMESVRAQYGTASGRTTGGYPISVSISGFPITYDIEDISIVFGSGLGRAQVVLLEQSDSNRTKIKTLVPPGNPGVVQIMVSNDVQGSLVSFEFEYFNGSIPEVESLASFMVYADGKNDISTIVPSMSLTTLRQSRRSQQIATFGGCTFLLDDALQLSSAGSCSATAGWLDLSYKNIASLAPGVFANMPSLQ